MAISPRRRRLKRYGAGDEKAKLNLQGVEAFMERRE